MPAHHRSARYGRYAGGPDPLAPPVDLAEALEAVAEDVMAGYSPEEALREHLRRGGRGDQQEEREEEGPAHSRMVTVKGTSSEASPSRSKARKTNVCGPGAASGTSKAAV